MSGPNPTPAEIRASLDGMEPGTEVTIRLADGTERKAIYSGTDAEQGVIVDSDETAVDLEQVTNVFIEGSTDDGPE